MQRHKLLSKNATGSKANRLLVKWTLTTKREGGKGVKGKLNIWAIIRLLES